MGAVVLALAAAPAALASASWWRIGSEVTPSYLPAGGSGQIIVVASNLGDAEVNASNSPVVITDKLPAGLTATAITAPTAHKTKVECTLETLRCTYAGVLDPYEQLTVAITVEADKSLGAMTSLSDEVRVEGGGAPTVSSTQQVTVSSEPTPFGVQHYELTPFNEDGTPATQAGSHPFQLTTTLVMNQAAQREPIALPKDLRFSLPPGLVGDPNAVAQCTMTNFVALVEETNLLLRRASAVGVATVTGYEPLAGVFTKTVPVFNLVPAQGEPARFGFEVVGKVQIVIDTSVNAEHNYTVVVSINNTTETAGLLSSQVTLWGVPGDAGHNKSRGWECVAGEAFRGEIGKPCPEAGETSQQAFLTLPTSCPANPAVEPFSSSMEADSWAQPASFLTKEYAWLSGSGEPMGLDDCNQLSFIPSIKVTPEEHTASMPTGLSVNVEMPQQTTLEANGLAEADMRDATVTLPEGVELSPGAANGLEACSEEQIGYKGLNQSAQTDEFTAAKPSCPQASKIGLVRIRTPLLSHELEGAVYLASPAPNGEEGKNPFDSLVSVYIVAEDPVSGVLVKLAGKGELSESTLRVATTFTNTPQLPFEDLKLELFGGPKGSLSTPARCGSYGTEAAFTPWSGTGTLDLSSPGTGIRNHVWPGRCTLPGRCAALQPGVRRAEHERSGRRVYGLRSRTLASRRRPGAQFCLHAPAAGQRRAALLDQAVLRSAGPSRCVSGGKPDRGSDGGRGPRT